MVSTAFGIVYTLKGSRFALKVKFYFQIWDTAIHASQFKSDTFHILFKMIPSTLLKLNNEWSVYKVFKPKNFPRKLI